MDAFFMTLVAATYALIVALAAFTDVSSIIIIGAGIVVSAAGLIASEYAE
jgi:hypothetical protein